MSDQPLVAAITRFPPRGAATRLRIMQYEPHLKAAGLRLELWSFFDDAGLVRWYEGGRRSRLRAVAAGVARLRKLPGLLRRADVVVVQRDVLAIGPPLVELIAARARPVVWDVDDSIWVRHRSLVAPTAVTRFRPDYERLCRAATEVWAGSEVLAQWCRAHSNNVHVVPTVVDVPDEVRPRSQRVAGWIGSPSTAPFLKQILPAIEGIDPPVRVTAVGGDHWSLEAEARALEQMTIGLYPIDRHHPLAEGKCALKAILYMAHGVVPVVTPTTTNAQVVRDHIDGLHAVTADDWRAAVSRLLSDDELRNRMAATGHQRIADDYSLATWGPIVAQRLKALAEASS